MTKTVFGTILMLTALFCTQALVACGGDREIAADEDGCGPVEEGIGTPSVSFRVPEGWSAASPRCPWSVNRVNGEFDFMESNYEANDLSDHESVFVCLRRPSSVGCSATEGRVITEFAEEGLEVLVYVGIQSPPVVNEADRDAWRAVEMSISA